MAGVEWGLKLLTMEFIELVEEVEGPLDVVKLFLWTILVDIGLSLVLPWPEKTLLPIHSGPDNRKKVQNKKLMKSKNSIS